jgi:hypothetical protein
MDIKIKSSTYNAMIIKELKLSLEKKSLVTRPPPPPPTIELPNMNQF